MKGVWHSTMMKVKALVMAGAAEEPDTVVEAAVVDEDEDTVETKVKVVEVEMLKFLLLKGCTVKLKMRTMRQSTMLSSC